MNRSTLPTPKRSDSNRDDAPDDKMQLRRRQLLVVLLSCPLLITAPRVTKSPERGSVCFYRHLDSPGVGGLRHDARGFLPAGAGRAGAGLGAVDTRGSVDVDLVEGLLQEELFGDGV